MPFPERLPTQSSLTDHSGVVDAVLAWYSRSARDLPWRRPTTTAWEVVVSEFMLQQTPVNRVLEPWCAWMTRWPDPAALAREPAGEAVRAWGRLGYPRRALRLHQAARVMVERHHGEVPRRLDDLLALPGVGSYTASAIATFAYGDRHCVLDTNVRRVLGRVAAGEALPTAAPTRRERATAERFLPEAAPRAARWAVAVMELGALVCTARSPRCPDCPIQQHCRWHALGRPPSAAPRVGQRYDGTDRQCRGALLARLRACPEPIALAALHAAWPDTDQRERCLDSLIHDGLAVRLTGDRVGLPGS